MRHERRAAQGAGAGEEAISEAERRDVCEETWVFRMEHADEFARLLQVRSSEVEPGPPGGGAGGGDGGAWRQCPIAAAVQCRPRGEEGGITCAECVRLLRGGPYPEWGILAPAFPPERNITKCLAQTRELPPGMELGTPQQVAFCNSVSVRFPAS